MSIVAEQSADPSSRGLLSPAEPHRLLLVQRWWLRGGLFLLPFAYSFDTYDSYVLPKLLFARLVVLGLLGFLVAIALTRGRLEIKRTRLDLPLLLFLVSAAISTALAYNVNTAIFGTYSRYDGLLTTLTYVALFWLAVQALDGPGDARAMLRVLLASGYVFALLSIVQAIGDAASLRPVHPAWATVGNSNVAGAFLAMSAPLAAFELAGATTWSGRLLAMNLLLALGVALALTLSRSAWLGVAAAGIVLVAGWRGWVPRVAVAAAMVVTAAALLLAGLQPGLSGQEHVVGQRFASILNPAELGSRPHIWQDSVRLIASRPLFGYGPDNFGLVYPNFQTGKWETSNGVEVPIDKAHAETLQVAATQGLLGLVAYLAILVALARSVWRSDRDDLQVAAFAVVVAYQVSLQLNFTALGAAFPYWIAVAAAVTLWNNPAARLAATPRSKPTVRATAGVSAIAIAALAAGVVVLPYIADTRLRDAVGADFGGRGEAARAAATQASALVPYESVYQVEIGNVAFERGLWAEARPAYLSADRLGTYNPRVLRNLALADRNLGLTAEALAAARRALALDRFDPANQALVDQLLVGSP